MESTAGHILIPAGRVIYYAQGIFQPAANLAYDEVKDVAQSVTLGRYPDIGFAVLRETDGRFPGYVEWLVQTVPHPGFGNAQYRHEFRDDDRVRWRFVPPSILFVGGVKDAFSELTNILQDLDIPFTELPEVSHVSFRLTEIVTHPDVV